MKFRPEGQGQDVWLQRSCSIGENSQMQCTDSRPGSTKENRCIFYHQKGICSPRPRRQRMRKKSQNPSKSLDWASLPLCVLLPSSVSPPLTLTPSLPSDNLSDFILNSTKGKLRWTLKPPPSHPSTHTHTESPILVSWNLSFHP